MPERDLTIVSGGQTGVDTAALRAGLALGYAIGGYAPQGFLREDGRIPDDLRPFLTETASEHPAVRTEANVRWSDATLIVCRGPLTGGTGLTAKLAERFGRPLLVVDVDDPDAADRVRDWVASLPFVRTLNVAGPRESVAPGIETAAGGILRSALLPR